MTKKWAAFPYADRAYVYDAAGLKKAWGRLHRGDCEPLPKDADALDAWRHYHAGEYAAAVASGRKAGGSAINAAVKAQMIYANYLEHAEKAKLGLLEEAADWAAARRREAPKDANAHYLHAYSLGRYSQGISIAKALAQGYGGRIKDALTMALKLEPKHADAHIAYGSYQADQRRLRPVVAKNLSEGKRTVRVKYGVDEDTCTGDHSCIRLSGCPTLTVKDNPDPLRRDPVATVIDGCVGCGLCGENAHAAVLCPSFYRAEVIQNPNFFDRAVQSVRNIFR